MYNESYSLSDPPSDQFPFFRRDEDEECEDAAAEPTQSYIIPPRGDDIRDGGDDMGHVIHHPPLSPSLPMAAGKLATLGTSS